MNDIARELGVSKSSVSLWVRDVEFTPVPGRTGARRRGPSARQRRKAAEIEEMNTLGIGRVAELSEREFLLSGVMLYAGEGSKTDGSVGLANSDAQIMRFFSVWLRRFFDVDETRLRVSVYLHQGLDLDAAEQHWSEVTGVPRCQFNKPYRAVPDGGIRHNKHEFGCATLVYSCSRTHRAIMGLVRALLSSESYSGVAQ